MEFINKRKKTIFLVKPLLILINEITLVLEYHLLRPHSILLKPYQGQTPADAGGWERQNHQSWAFRAFLSISIDLSGL